MKANERKTKKSSAVGYGTFGKSVRASSPRKVIVSTVVIPENSTCINFPRLVRFYLTISGQRLLHDSAKTRPMTKRPEEYKDHTLG